MKTFSIMLWIISSSSSSSSLFTATLFSCLFLHRVTGNTAAAAISSQCRLEIRNRSGSSFSAHWINPKTNDQVFMASTQNDAAFAADTYIGHTFLLTELPNETTGTCGNAITKIHTCRSTTIKVTKPTNELVFLTKDFKITTDGALANQDFFNDLPEDPVVYCKEWAKDMFEQLKNKGGDSEAQKNIILSQVSECIKTGLTPTLLKLREEYHFEKNIRELVSTQMENFTCSDPNFETTPDIDLRYWTSEKDHVTREVHVKLDRPASRIHVVSNFANQDECDAMEVVAKPKLHDASVADGKGGIQMSQNRKAKQAGITPDFSKEAEGDLVARLSRRVYDYTNYVLGMNITEHGQEPLMSIQYFGRGYNDTEPDRYTPHCDGKCDGLEHYYGTRMATMVIYCTIPEKGGHTNFQNAGVHIKPEVGNAIFFSYIDPTTNLTDHGLTTHSGCPVYEGEKKIITQWVRYGVDAGERMHSKFNTLGILHAESGDN